MQSIVVAIVLLACVGYIVWLAVDTFSHAGDPCRGCEGCALKDLKRRNLSRKERKLCREAKKSGKNLVE